MPSSPYDQQPWLAHYRIANSVPPPPGTLLDVLEGNAASHQQDIAIQYFERSWTWAELERDATRFAAQLARAGVGRGDRIGLSLQNNPQFAIAQYGAWKRAAAIVPLNPMYREEELAYQLRDAGVKLWLGLESVFPTVVSALDRAGVEHVLTTTEAYAADDPFADLLEKANPQPSDRLKLTGSDLAHIVYTSGTTGKPKGAMGLHRHIAYNANIFRTWMALGPGDAVLGMAPLFHITGLVAHLGVSALARIPLILFHRFQPSMALQMARLHRATFSVASITAYIALLNDAGLRDGPFLDKCFTGGAPVAPSIVEQFESACGAYIHNTYGLTEVNSPSHLVPFGARAPVDPASGALSIGLPIPGCRPRIVDLADPGREVPPGEPGELVLKGPFVFEGYWENPEATRAAFHDGWFLTGDVAVMDEQGWFYIVDRKKDMINASGFKVWPREVEDVLYQHPAVREAAVIGVPDPYRGETVKAVLALRSDSPQPTPEAIEAFCRERLAAFKVPRQVEFVDDIPKTATGKFLRRALRNQ